jgi:UDP-glucose 4-epimerase
MTEASVQTARDGYRGKRVLVTGATGFVGGHLLRALSDAGAAVAVLTRGDAAMPVPARVFTGQLADRDFVRLALQVWQPQVVFHVAGARERSLSREAFDKTIEANLVGTLNLLYGAVGLAGLERIVVLGTGEEYGRSRAPFGETLREEPVSAYSFSKQCATQLSQLMHRSFGLPVTVLRPAVAYGPGQQSDMFLPALIQTLLLGEEFNMTAGEQTRDYVYIDDLVEALLLAGTGALIDGEIINVGGGQAVRIAELVERVEAQLDCKGLVRRGALPYRTGEAMEYELDVSKARALLGWAPRTSLDEGLRRTVAWYRKGHA